MSAGGDISTGGSHFPRGDNHKVCIKTYK
jgi:hypothetical protein